MDDPATPYVTEGTGLGETEFPEEGKTEVWQIINTTADAHPMHLHLVQFQLVSRQPYNINNYLKAYNAAFTGALYVPFVGPPKPYNTPLHSLVRNSPRPLT
jgi:FtsP/CotA-like multicopper oxidase with cupredoxin domain